VAFEKINLLLQFQRVNPIVVTLAERDVLPLTGQKSSLNIRHYAKVFFTRQYSHTGIALRDFLADRRSIVRTAVIADYQFERECNLLV
jgi:hypothetical protein